MATANGKWHSTLACPSAATGLTNITRSRGPIHHSALRRTERVGGEARRRPARGRRNHRHAPARVAGLQHRHIAAGVVHSLTRPDGEVWVTASWRWHERRLTPVQVAGHKRYCDLRWQIHSLALRQTGRCGRGVTTATPARDGTFSNRTTPVQVTGPATLPPSTARTLALLTDKTVRAWGYNGNGQLGDGTTNRADASDCQRA